MASGGRVVNKGGGRRMVLITLDGCGVGELPDAEQYGDVGANVITSYSIHYTKLYEGRSPLRDDRELQRRLCAW